MISEIAAYLPSGRLSNEDLVAELGKWTPDEVFAKTGIRTRCVADAGDTAADLGARALGSLLAKCDPSRIDFLILCTQSADYKMPSSACLMQAATGLPSHCGCMDINLACSGFIYGLMVAESLILSRVASQVALVNSDTYTRYIHPGDTVCRPIFGDGAAATLLNGIAGGGRVRGFSYGSDGAQALQMYLPAGGARNPGFRDPRSPGHHCNLGDPEFLRMNGPEIYNFTLQVVPRAVSDTLAKCGISVSDVDFFVFHQANGFMLESLRRKIGLPREKFIVEMAETGNLVSASIPVVLDRMRSDGRIRPGIRTVLCGFGVGLSWASCLVEW
jgi:3-oxoacyl-[acyl-carrier-protein] synthase-3